MADGFSTFFQSFCKATRVTQSCEDILLIVHNMIQRLDFFFILKKEKDKW